MAIEYVMFALAVFMFIVLIAIWSLHFISLVYGKYKFHRKTKCNIEKDNLPGVSIIKPLMGIDDNLAENLETFFVMDYPVYEILFCVQDNTDPVINLVKDLLEKYPNIDAKLFSGGKNVGINPKINNMMQGYEMVKYDLILISDAGLKMSKDTLYDMVSLMTEKVGLVHQMPFACDRPGFAGSLEKVYFGTCHCRMYLFINLIGVNCVTGMSCLMRKNVIDQAGGLQKFGNYIAEDYYIAQTFLDNNWIIQLSHQPALQNSGNYSVSLWQKRMIRWCKLRLKLTIMSWLEPMQECFMLGLTTSWTVNFLFGWNSLVFFMIHVLGWFLCDYLLLKITQNGKLPFTKLDYVLSWFYRESICLYLFVKAASNPTVKWRDGKYRLKWGGLAEEIKENNKEKKLNINHSLIETASNKKHILPGSNVNSSISLSVNSKSTLTHKRNNSYSVLMNSNNFNQNLNSINTSLHSTIKSDVDNQTIPLLSSNYGSSSPSAMANSTVKNFSQSPNFNNNNSQKLFGQTRSHHQQHHSISSPITSSTFNSIQQNQS